MDKSAKVLLFIILTLSFLFFIGFAVAKPGGGSSSGKECWDGIDNDGDGLVDLADSGCEDKKDNDESNCGDSVCEGDETYLNCLADCIPPQICGNEIIENPEICDGNTQSCILGGYLGTQGCNSQCTGYGSCTTTEYCGDAIVNGPEFCDSSYQACNTTDNYSGMQSCNIQCTGYDSCITTEYCGDSIVNGPEFCDDGNNLNGDGCSAVCEIEIISDSCSETDGGINYYLRGDVTAYLDGTSYSYSDFCVSKSTIFEYYCIGDYAYGFNITCPQNSSGDISCYSGACH